MNIEVISMWYNEEFLAPLFLDHYSYADRITVLFDSDSNDGSLSVIKKDPRVRIVPFRFPDMMDDGIKQNKVNKQYRESDADWAVLVDADEFIFYRENGEPQSNLRPFLEKAAADIFCVRMLDVYRHRTDKDLDRSLPALLQRRHGTVRGIKPCVARCGIDATWRVGCHEVIVDPALAKFGHGQLYSAHWAMADLCFAVERRVKHRRARQSRRNLETGMTSHNHSITVKSVSDEANAQFDAEQLF